MNSTFQMGINPIQVWFVCRLCKSSCQKIEEFIAHKQQKHFHEFQKIRCIIFEEKTLDQEFSKSFNVENFGTDFSSGVQHFQEPQTSSESGNMNKINTNEINPVGTKTINAQQYFRQVDHQPGAGTGGGGVGVLEELRGYRYAIEPQSSRTTDSDLIVHSQTQVNDNITFNVSVPVLPHDQSRLNFEINNLSQHVVTTPSGFCPNNSDKNPSLQVPIVQIKKECIPILTSTPPNQRTEKRPVCCSFSKLNFDLNPQDLSLLIEIDPDPASDNFGIGTDSKIPYEYQCKLCGTKFDSDREVRIHIKHCWVHNKQRHRFCVLCKKSFFDAFAYRRHILRFHATEEEKASRPKFTCYFCPKEFTEKSSLKKHFLKFHVTSHKGSISNSSNSSMKLAGGPGPDGISNPHARPFICQLCGVDFGRQADLTKHERTHSHHSDPSPHHPVPNCSNNSNNNSSNNNKSFQTFQTFLNPHSESLSRQFKCTQNNCSKTFTRSYHLTRHMVQKHSAEGDLKTFKCETCNKTFSTRSLLQNHSSVHTQDKPYKCTHLGCSSAFKRKDVLVQHEKTHTGERPHKCDVCGKAFSKRFSYLKHSRIHTNNSNNNSSSQNQNQHHPALSLC